MTDTALPPVTLVILGASGDLTHRLLLPGLGTLLTEKPYDVTLIGAAMAPLTDGEWKALVEAALKDAKLRPSRIEAVLAKTRYINVDVTNKDNWLALLPNLPENSVLYFALPPAVTAKACQVLATLDLPKGLKLALEKPFGTSLESAKELNHLLMSVVPENQIFRVDHFLGKATVLNLLGIRFTNRIFEPIWDCGDIESVSIIVDETLGLEGRAGYYDNNGALKDMIQSHLLLMMAIFAMEEPASLDEREVRDLIAHTLRATTLWTDDPVTSSRRARYTS
ncbi:MAG TPA: glucose-6-phosphate dehydrogenase, partial [Propionibacteriaceae bacterium]|nr:glucose-6-phosphate dehydrogenase [Propionibacteriaceae bacterium]HBY24003.1 glucose-6-phosphate dehydrogenase [Propionibacteriaceae bacterium]